MKLLIFIIFSDVFLCFFVERKLNIPSVLLSF